MLKVTRRLSLAIGLTFWMQAWAIMPESGWWWNGMSGSGFNIETQDNLLFFAAFGYDTAGQPVWYFAGGPMTSDRDFSAMLYRTSGGSCVGCEYAAPTVTEVGEMTLSFTSSQTANLTLLGTTVPATRFNFWLNDRVPDALLGEWSMVTGDPVYPVYFADRISFSSKNAAGDALYGYRTGATGRAAVAMYSVSDGSWGILIDTSTSYYTFYSFVTTGFNRLEGRAWTYLKTQTLSGSGIFFLGHRTKSYHYVLNGTGPGASKSLSEDPVSLEEVAAQRAKNQPMDGEVPANIRDLASKAEAILKGAQQ